MDILNDELLFLYIKRGLTAVVGTFSFTMLFLLIKSMIRLRRIRYHMDKHDFYKIC
jgi:hypothetical protein